MSESATNEELEEALENFALAVEAAPDNFGAWHNRAHTLERLGRTDEAAEMEKATAQKEAEAASAPGQDGVGSKEPESEPATGASNEAFETAMRLFSEEKWGDAKASFLSAIELGDARVSRCYNGIGLCLSVSESATNEELEEALTNFGRAVEAAPDNYGAWHNRAHTLERLGRTEEAAEMEQTTAEKEAAAGGAE